jgi:hypothetical protein
LQIKLSQSIKKHLTQKFKIQFDDIVFLFELLRGVTHLVEDATKALAVVVGVGEVGKTLDEVSLAVGGRVGLAGSNLTLKQKNIDVIK